MGLTSHGLFRRYDTPPADAAKGGCYVYYDAGPGVDTGILIDFEGDLCLSLVAIRELAEVAGYRLNEEAEKLERDNAWLVLENIKLTDERDGYKDIIEGFGKVVAKGTKR
jgi:hypothetical protein